MNVHTWVWGEAEASTETTAKGRLVGRSPQWRHTGQEGPWPPLSVPLLWGLWEGDGVPTDIWQQVAPGPTRSLCEVLGMAA